ncbi:MAG: hypothetical protein ACYC69_14140 [Thermodesulfovibrionales bacterium]
MVYKHLDPKRVNNFLDSCAFDPKYSPEDEAAERIRKFGNDGLVNLILAHSNQKEIEHPNTPQSIKKAAVGMIYTIEGALTPEEKRRKSAIHATLTGNGKPETYAADAAHVFEAGKYGGYFITTDDRILKKRKELQDLSGAVILKPSEWLKVLED